MSRLQPFVAPRGLPGGRKFAFYDRSAGISRIIFQRQRLRFLKLISGAGLFRRAELRRFGAIPINAPFSIYMDGIFRAQFRKNAGLAVAWQSLSISFEYINMVISNPRRRNALRARVHLHGALQMHPVGRHIPVFPARETCDTNGHRHPSPSYPRRTEA